MFGPLLITSKERKKRQEEQLNVIKFYKLSCALALSNFTEFLENNNKSSELFEISQVWESSNVKSSNGSFEYPSIRRLYIHEKGDKNKFNFDFFPTYFF